MNTVYLGLGSNLGNRRMHLESALGEISKITKDNSVRLSSVYETPALLPQNAPADWNKPFWNLVAEIKFRGSPQELLTHIQNIELSQGRIREEHWSPRTIDIDILHWDDITWNENNLRLPHPKISERAFVLDPLAELVPTLRLPSSDAPILEQARRHPQHSPLLMGIINITPDSFSDGGVHQNFYHIEETLVRWETLPVAMIDFGGESTRPGAVPVSLEEERQRIFPILSLIHDKKQNCFLRPKTSVDTRQPEIAALALESGVDIINDVSGLSNPRMLEVLQLSSCKFVLMHSLMVPADAHLTIGQNQIPSEEIHRWFEDKFEFLEKSGIKRDRMIIDPGIGFGKTSVQSLRLLRDLKWVQSFNCPVLVGHSRKSFLKTLESEEPQERDPETLGLSLALTEKGVDILRVHDPVLHHRALMSWRSIRQ